jgi:Protein of unknown function (DUF3611)
MKLMFFKKPDTPPTAQQVSRWLRTSGWIGFWIQLVLGVVAAVVLLFASASRNVSTGQGAPPETGIGFLFAFLAIATLAVSIFWCFRYTRMGQKMLSAARPSRQQAIQMVQMGLMISLIGMLVAIVGEFAIVGNLFAKTLVRGQGGGFEGLIEQQVRPVDVFIVQANTNTIAAHFAGIITALWISARIDDQ